MVKDLDVVKPDVVKEVVKDPDAPKNPEMDMQGACYCPGLPVRHNACKSPA
ncbi:MAG: hypothetical protein HPY52_10895 [Firmicutes bacterium]|nr:hypothetical protein [Bacillota bacterium]